MPSPENKHCKYSTNNLDIFHILFNLSLRSGRVVIVFSQAMYLYWVLVFNLFPFYRIFARLATVVPTTCVYLLC